MTNQTLEVFVAAYSDETGAGVAARDLKDMQLAGSIHLVDAAVIVRRADGKVHIEETADPSGKTWAKRGAIAGGLVGLIFPPAVLASAAVTAGAGGVWGKIRDKGFKDEDLKAVGESLEPGSSALIAIAEDKVVENLTKGIEGYARLTRHVLSADAGAVLLAEAEPTPA